MTYKKKELLNIALNAIPKNNLIFLSEVIFFLPCSSSTFYEKFKTGEPDRLAIESALNENKIKMKINLRDKWYKSDLPQLQIALMKLLSTEEEFRLLSMSKIENKTELSGSLAIEPITGMIIN
jgi:hypothetical protein